jgi:uncharacterized protein DUF2877
MTAIAAPVMARLPPGWEARAAEPGLLDLDGFVALIAPAGTPWLPNAIVLDTGPAVVWDPVLPALVPGRALARRGRAVLAALGEADDSALRPSPEAIDALCRGDMAAAVTGLLGRGAGLTPEGDDLLAGAFAVLAAVGAPVAPPDDLRERTTALSATLLELAAAGAAPRPLHAVLDVRDGHWRGALRELARLGSSSGRAIAFGAAATAARYGPPTRLAADCAKLGA